MADGRLRLFVALELPAEVAGRLWEWGRSVAGASGGLRAVGAESLHVTLCFLGSRPAGDVAGVATACERSAGRAVRNLGLGEAMWLPRRRPRVLALAIDDPGGQLAGLQAEVAGSLVSGGLLEPETRPYLPHVTVARVRGETRVTARDRDVVAPESGRFDGKRLTVYRSLLGAGPARYEPLHQVGLSGEIIRP